jgi:hypothetical protein
VCDLIHVQQLHAVNDLMEELAGLHLRDVFLSHDVVEHLAAGKE